MLVVRLYFLQERRFVAYRKASTGSTMLKLAAKPSHVSPRDERMISERMLTSQVFTVPIG